MKIKLFLAALCLFLLPLCFAGTSSQFSAYASGYMVTAGVIVECECEEAGCSGGTCGESLTNPDPESNTSSSLGPESLLILGGLMLWLRLRA